MSVLFKKVEVKDEKELENLIATHPEQIEGGLKLLGTQVRTSYGPLDILCVDKNGSLVVIELKRGEDAYQLTQALKYYDWVYENRSTLALFYPEKGIDIKQQPRIILIAQGFAEDLLITAKYLYAFMKTPDLMTYSFLETPSGERGLVFNNIEVPPLPPTPYEPIEREKLWDQIVNWITDDGVKKLLLETIEKIKSIGEVDAYAVKWNLSFKAKDGKVFAGVGTARDHFNVWTTRDWIKTVVYSSEDLTPEFWEKLKAFFVECGGKLKTTWISP